MDLYFLPLACSMASRIAIYEANATANFIEVDHDTKRASDGNDLHAINPLGLVPVLRTDSGDVLTENSAILAYLARQLPGARLGPTEGPELAQLQRWLGFISTELHAGLFSTLLNRKAPAEVKRWVFDKHRARLDLLAEHLRDREYLLDSFTVADAYLVTVLNWTRATEIKLADWPPLAAYVARISQRPAVARALQEEFARFTAQAAQAKASPQPTK